MNRRTFIKGLLAIPVAAIAGKVIAEKPKQGWKLAGVITGRVSSERSSLQELEKDITSAYLSAIHNDTYLQLANDIHISRYQAKKLLHAFNYRRSIHA